MIYATRPLNKIRFATIHHSGGGSMPANMAQLKSKMAAYDAGHAGRGFPTTRGEFGYKHLLYSFAVAANGDWMQTQDLKYQLYHATDWYKGAESANQWGFGILLVGNFEHMRPTDAQLESAARIIHKFNRENNTRLIVKGHREFAAPRYSTLCPGANMGLSYDPNSKLSWIVQRVIELRTRPMIVTATANLNVRAGASTQYAAIGLLKKGQSVTVIDEVRGQSVFGVNVWYKFALNGGVGYAHSNWLKE